MSNDTTDLRERLLGYDCDTPDEEVLLREVMRTLDVIDVLEAHIAEHGVVLTGARGQPLANPSLTAVARQRAMLERLMARLWPRPETAGQRRTRAASNARWSRRG